MELVTVFIVGGIFMPIRIWFVSIPIIVAGIALSIRKKAFKYFLYSIFVNFIVGGVFSLFLYISIGL